MNIKEVLISIITIFCNYICFGFVVAFNFPGCGFRGLEQQSSNYFEPWIFNYSRLPYCEVLFSNKEENTKKCSP